MSEILSIAGLTKNYGSIRAIQDLNLQIEKGQVFGILGPNGSGKTTTLSIITGILNATSGDYTWFGHITGPEALKRIGALIEIPYFYPYLSLYDNLRILASIKSVPVNDISRVLGLTGLLQRKHSKYNTLSLGMKQRLGLAAAMLGDPEVLVLDEPTNGLDPEGFAEVRELIQNEASKGKTIILASHILDEVEKVCTHLAVLKKGLIISSGSMKEIQSGEEQVRVVADQPEALKESLVRNGWIKDIRLEGNELTLTLSAGKTARELNAFAFKNGFLLEKIEVHKHSLESQFLDLVKE